MPNSKKNDIMIELTTMSGLTKKVIGKLEGY